MLIGMALQRVLRAFHHPSCADREIFQLVAIGFL
jgi:hypothetical protein